MLNRRKTHLPVTQRIAESQMKFVVYKCNPNARKLSSGEMKNQEMKNELCRTFTGNEKHVLCRTFTAGRYPTENLHPWTPSDGKTEQKLQSNQPCFDWLAGWLVVGWLLVADNLLRGLLREKNKSQRELVGPFKLLSCGKSTSFAENRFNRN